MANRLPRDGLKQVLTWLPNQTLGERMPLMLKLCAALVLLGCSFALPLCAHTGSVAETAVMAERHSVAADMSLKNFRFQSGEFLPQLKLHYQTLGQPRLGLDGHVANAVPVLHETDGWGISFSLPDMPASSLAPVSRWMYRSIS
jgi:hypothetical protein